MLQFRTGGGHETVMKERDNASYALLTVYCCECNNQIIASWIITNSATIIFLVSIGNSEEQLLM
jgi:hypothetical protein